MELGKKISLADEGSSFRSSRQGRMNDMKLFII